MQRLVGAGFSRTGAFTTTTPSGRGNHQGRHLPAVLDVLGHLARGSLDLLWLGKLPLDDLPRRPRRSGVLRAPVLLPATWPTSTAMRLNEPGLTDPAQLIGSNA